MNIILIMIPMALILLIAAGIGFFWAVNHGQFDDMESPGLIPVSDNLPDDDDNPEAKTAQARKEDDEQEDDDSKDTAEKPGSQ